MLSIITLYGLITYVAFNIFALFRGRNLYTVFNIDTLYGGRIARNMVQHNLSIWRQNFQTRQSVKHSLSFMVEALDLYKSLHNESYFHCK